ncbi:MAG: DUF563 domain-containing protein, partial [Bacteroidetes bacterium]|nr:DUF563 domain-containing protein [Bacteroidota bacterium]
MKPLRAVKRAFEYGFRITGLAGIYGRYHFRNRIELSRMAETSGCSGISGLGMIEEPSAEESIQKTLRLLLEEFSPLGVLVKEVPLFCFTEKKAWAVQNAHLTGKSALATLNGRVITEALYYTDVFFDQFLQQSICRAPTWTLPSLKPFHIYSPKRKRKKLQNALVLYGHWANYYHWITQHLPKLRAAEKYREATGRLPLLILPPQPSKVYLDSLKEAGFEEAETICWWNGRAEVDELVLMNYPESTPDSLNWLRKRILKPENKPGRSASGRRIYVSRADAKSRRVMNEDEILPLLQAYGFEKVILSESTFKEQVSLFRSAEMVIGPHGAGLTNLIWGENLKVVEFFGEELRFHYAKISRLLGFKYRALNCRLLPGSEDMLVDPARLEKAICSML